MRVQPVHQCGLTEFENLCQLLGAERTRRLQESAREISAALGGATLWHVNSTAAGGGVAEMLDVLLPIYARLGVRVGWIVIDGSEPFFEATKRLGDALYGGVDDQADAGLSVDLRKVYRETLRHNADDIVALLGPADMVYLHDHQAAGLVPLLSEHAAKVFWRCHVGVDAPTPASRDAWDFLQPWVEGADAVVFSVPQHRPSSLAGTPSFIIPPIISPFTPKNQELDAESVGTALARCGLAAPARSGPVAGRPVPVLADRPPRPQEPLVVQVSRWDRLKDMSGVLEGFAAHTDEGFLALVGPDPTAIADDISQQFWFEHCRRARERLAPAQRERTALITLPMADARENALLVNGLQRAADVVVQKSLAEGFGLTVAEAMWKQRPVVASDVGGISAQIEHGVTGYLVKDPRAYAAFGELLSDVLSDRRGRTEVGRLARSSVHRQYLADGDVAATAELVRVAR